MQFKELLKNPNIEFGEMEESFFLLGLLSAFDNRYQATADRFFEEMSWKQFFAIICIGLCKENPTINELAGIMGSSHQNVKQILLKLEKKGFVAVIVDEEDKRKQRVIITEKTKKFCKEHEAGSNKAVAAIFAGITKEQLQTTIQTIMQMEENLNQEGEW